MPTKLKKPIVLTITHVENAVALYLKMLNPLDRSDARQVRIIESMSRSRLEVASQLMDGLDLNDIDAGQWEPPQPFKIGAHETTFNPNGSIDVGCTKIDRATLVEVLKRSDEAMQNAEPEWPKFIKASGVIGRFESEFANGMWHYKSGQTCTTDCCMGHYLKEPGFKQIPRAEASAILGRDV